MPLSELAVSGRVVGERQVRRALEKRALRKLFIAMDSDVFLIEDLVKMAEAAGLEIEKVDSKLKLGRACAIDRSAAVAGLPGGPDL